jgi:magnesium-transporting ATPase (P-type)
MAEALCVPASVMSHLVSTRGSLIRICTRSDFARAVLTLTARFLGRSPRDHERLPPAEALGAEPSSPRALAQPPLGHHLMNGSLLFRAFGVLGLTESIVEMVTFLAALLFAGWRPGLAFLSGGALLSASGAAFTAVVGSQIASTFDCRSASLWPGKLGWFSNRYLVIAIFCTITF